MSYPDGITKEMVDASAEEFVEKIRPNVRQLDALIEQAVNLVMEKKTLTQKNEEMEEIAAGIDSILSPHLICGEGCSNCCYMAVGITPYEAQKIGEYLGVPVHQPPPFGMDTMETLVARYSGVPCPFLKKKRCSIYEVRPLPCRTHYNISKYKEICDTINHYGCDTPTINLQPLWYAAAAVNIGSGDFGDIREFFPFGAEEVQKL